MSILLRCMLVIILCYVAPTFATLSSQEEQLRTYIVKQNKSSLVLLKKLVNTNSGTSNVRGVKSVGNIMQTELKKLGFKVHWVKLPTNMHKAPTLVAEHSGKQGKRILLIGHLDTVFASNDTFKRYEMKTNTVKGPGVNDDKGGLVVIVSALKALASIHALKDASITIVLTGDEEDTGKPVSISRKPLMTAAKGQDITLDFEPSVTLETATIARRGITNWTIQTTGNESHSAAIFHPGIGAGAIFELANILNTMRTELSTEQYLSFNPGLIIGGTKATLNEKTASGTAFGKQNVVAKIAIAKGDLRYISSDQKIAAENNINAIVNQPLADTHANISYQDGMPAMPPTENNKKLLDQYSQVSQDLGQGPVKALDPAQRGAGDISFVAEIVPANLSGLGPMGYGAHSKDEHMVLTSLPIQTERAAVLMYRLITQ